MVSDPPEQRRTSWALVGTVALLCSIISAAGVVAFKELQDGTVRMDRAVETKESARAATANVEAARSEEAAQAPVAQANVVPSASAPSVSPMPSVEQLPAATFNVAPPSADPTPPAAQPGEISPSAEQALAPPAQAAPAPAVALQIAPALSAPLSRAPSAPTALPSGGARKIGARAPAAAADTQQPAEGEGEVVALPSALTPSDTKTVLTQLADQERATAAAEEVKREEERKLPSTARLKAPSVRIEAARIAAALKKASQEAVARVNEEQAPAAAPAAVAPAAPAAPVAPPKAEPENAGTLPDNPF